MGTDSPLLPLIGVSVGLFALVGVLVFVVLKLRTAGRETSQAGRDRLSEEAFAAATIKAALANRPAAVASPAVAPSAAVTPGADTVDAAVLEALPVGLIVTDEAGVVRRCTAPAR